MIVVNFSTEHYLNGQKRLSRSLNGHKQLMLNDYVSIGSPTHQESPYEFKLHSIEKAFQFDDIVLYCDASMFVVGDLNKIEQIILQKGYFMEEAGHYCKDWCNDHATRFLNFDKLETEKHYLMFSAGLLGLNKNNRSAMIWFEAWKTAAKHGCFRGDWNSHRHDMVVGSILAKRMGFTYERGGSHMAYIGPGYSQPEPGVVMLCQGML